MPETGATTPYRPDIDGLRAVAVLAVLLYHAGLAVPGGYLGVDIFFVISGYLIIPIIYAPMIEGRFSAAEFFERRTRRLMPALSAMLLGTALLSLYQLIAPDLEAFGGSLVAASLFVSNIYFYVTNTEYFVESALTRPLLHTWSLGVEEQFYILAPVGLWVLIRLAPRRLHVPGILIFSLLSFALSAWKWSQGSPAAFYLLPTRAWELGLGGALALAAPGGGRGRGTAEALSLCGLGAIAVALAVGGEDGSNSIWMSALAAVGTAAILATGAHSGALVRHLLALGPFAFVGRISYSLYLWHWPVIVALSYGSASSPTPGSALWAIAISIGLAAASWRWIEQPVRTRRWLASRRLLFGVAALTLVAGVAAGLALVAGKGFPQRHPQLAPLLDPSRLRLPRIDCFKATAVLAKAGALCVRGMPGVAPSFVLVGDSHAHSISQVIFDSARRHGLAGTEFAAPGFFPLVGRQARFGGKPDPLLPLLEDHLRRRPELHTVIVTAFWSHAATGLSYREPVRLHIDAGYGSRPDYNPIAFRNGLEGLVDAFPDRRFILLDDVPTGHALSSLHHARQIHAGISVPVPGLPRADADKQRATYEPILEGIAARRSNVVYVPALSGLCGPQVCPLFDPRGKLLYMDGDHVNQHGSERLAAALDPIFRNWPGARAAPAGAAKD